MGLYFEGLNSGLKAKLRHNTGYVRVFYSAFIRFIALPCLTFAPISKFRSPPSQNPRCAPENTNKAKHKIQYSNLDSAILPVPLSTEISVPVFVKFKDCDDVNSTFVSEADDVTDLDFLDISAISSCSSTSTVLQLLQQSEHYDLLRNLTLSKISAELLASRLNEKHPIYSNTRTTYYCEREQQACYYFIQEESIVFCHNIEGLLLYLAVSYDPHDWRLFLNNWKQGLNCALIHNGNEYAVAPVGNSVHTKETCEKRKRLLSLIRYVDQKWIICHGPPTLIFKPKKVHKF